MSALSQLVATHMQCLRIPRGCFKDSAMVWARRTGYDVAHVVTRAYAKEMGWQVDAPAPTAQEVFTALLECRMIPHVRCAYEMVWSVSLPGYLGEVIEEFGKNLAQIAMKLWLKHCKGQCGDAVHRRAGKAYSRA